MKCSDCNYKLLEKYSGGLSRFYCKHPNAEDGIGSRKIGKTMRGSSELTIKTAPKWCPIKNKQRIQKNEN